MFNAHSIPLVTTSDCIYPQNAPSLTSAASNARIRKTPLTSLVDENGERDWDEIRKEVESFPINFFDTIIDAGPEQQKHRQVQALEIRKAFEKEQYVQTGAGQTICCIIREHFNDHSEVVKREYIPIASVLKDKPVNVSTYDVEFSPCRSTDGSLFIRPTIIVDDPLPEFLLTLEASIGGEVINYSDHDIIDELSDYHDRHHGNTPTGESTYQHIRPLSI